MDSTNVCAGHFSQGEIMKLKLRSQLLLPTLGIIVLCLTVAGSVSYRTAKTAVQAALQDQMKSVAESIHKQVDGQLGELMRTFQTLSGRSVVQDCLRQAAEGVDDSQTLNVALKKMLGDYPGQFEFLAVADRDGLVRASSSPDLVGNLRLADRDYFKHNLAGKVDKELVQSKATGEPVLVLSFPVTSAGQVIGVCLGAIHLSYIGAHYIEPVRIAQKGYAYLVDEAGRFLVHPEKAKQLRESIATNDWGRDMLAAKNGFEIYDWEGGRKVVAFRTIDQTNWMVVAGADFEDIFAPLAAIRWMSLLAGAIILVGVGGVLFWVAHSIVKAVRQGVAFAQDVRAGDVSRRLKLRRHDEIGTLAAALDSMADGLEQKAQLAEKIAGGDLTEEVVLASDRDRLGLALRQMNDSLNSILSEVQMAGEQIAAGSVQVADGSQSLSQGATESAASLEEISSSLVQLGSQTKHNAENANQANGLSNGSKEAASTGDALMRDLVEAMSDINQSGESITRIIKVIDEIAFQTNLLALNAAVEAARAGQHGKGFAVVAEEVRNLAARSAKAAKETAELIQTSTEKTKRGAEIADKTAEALKKIVGGAAKVSDLVAEIAAASHEQSTGLEEVSRGLNQIETVTQQATANSEESAAAAEELSGQADQMRRMLGRFKVRSASHRAVPETASKTTPTLLPSTPSRTRSDSPDSRSDSPDSRSDRPDSRAAAPPESVIALDDREFGKF
jgi:methyl-accepting chemotaxis protein